MDEIELKFFDIDVNEIKKKLKKIGAKERYNALMEFQVFFSEIFHGYDSSKHFLRVRKVNDDVQITYKAPAKNSVLSQTANSSSSREELFKLNKTCFLSIIKNFEFRFVFWGLMLYLL